MVKLYNALRSQSLSQFNFTFALEFRWWQETQNDGDQVVGVLYSVSSDEDADSGILLELRKEKVHTEYGGAEEGFSGRQYALIGEAMWLQALKR